MANIKVYLGAITDNKQRKLVRELQKAVSNNAVKDAEFLNTFKAATTPEELSALHTEYCTEAIDFEELNLPDSEKEVSDKIDNLNVGDEEPKYKATFGDPLNSAQPIERDYIHNDGFTESKSATADANTVFNEPTNFSDAFELPSLDDDGEDTGSSNKPGEKKKKPEQKPAMNPAFDDMTAAKKRKQSKMFAKHVVEGVCSIAEMGFIWFATKDTNEAKLIEYELTSEIDLSLLLSLEGGQEITIKTWFIGMNVKAEQLAAFDQESKDDLADALAEVMLEKGIAPTPTQNLLMIAFNVFIVDKGRAMLLHKMEIGGVLTQLKSMRADQVAQQKDKEQEQYQEERPNPTKVEEGSVSQDLIKEEESESTELATTEE